MNKPNIEQELLSITGRAANERFVKATMLQLQRRQTAGTYEHVLRTTSTINENGGFFMKLKQLPHFAMVGIVLGLTLVSGTAFAAYQYWQKPTADVVGVQSINGQDQITMKLQGCKHMHEQSMFRAIVSPQASLSSADAAKATQAFCEIAAINNWAVDDLRLDSSSVSYAAYTVESVADKTIAAHHGQEGRNITITNKTMFLANGTAIKQSDIKQGDVITFVRHTSERDSAVAVIKLSLPAQFYEPAIQNSVYRVDTCMGNPNEDCIAAPMADIYPYGQEGGALDKAGHHWRIQGKLVERTDDAFIIRSSSGKAFTVHLNSKVLASFNERQPKYTVTLGDTMTIEYDQPDSARSFTIESDQVIWLTLLLDGNAKAGTDTKF